MERTLQVESSSLFEFFGLSENPFSLSPNSRFLCPTLLTENASQQLADGIRRRRGLMLLTGEVGTGKTFLLHRLLDWLTGQKMPVAWIFNSLVDPEDLLDLVLGDFGVRCKSALKSDKLRTLNRWLIERHGLGQTPVVIVDEAQGLPLDTLEEIRLLLNLETPREKLIQIILAGQPELEERLKRYDLRQLRQRIAVRCKTAPLTLQETQAYICKHLCIAGADKQIFDDEASALVHAYSRGIPRVINLLCEHSLINACAAESRFVCARFVEQAADDCQLDNAEAVRQFNHSCLQENCFDGISPIFAGLPRPDSALLRSVDSSVLWDAASASVDSEVCVPMMDFSSSEPVKAETIVAVKEKAPNGLDSGRTPGGVAPAGMTSLFPSTPRKDRTGPTKHDPHAVIQTRTALASPVRRPYRRGGPSNTVASLFLAWRSFSAESRLTCHQMLVQCGRCKDRLRSTFSSLFRGWWKSFSADVRSTQRQIDRLLRHSRPRNT